jgi:hypothetical protein
MPHEPARKTNILQHLEVSARNDEYSALYRTLKTGALPEMATRKRTTKRRGISRIDQESTRTHGWFVRVGYFETKNGTYKAKHTKFFGDVTHGGKKSALTAAEKFVKSVDKKPAKKAAAKKAPAKKKTMARKVRRAA